MYLLGSVLPLLTRIDCNHDEGKPQLGAKVIGRPSPSTSSDNAPNVSVFLHESREAKDGNTSSHRTSASIHPHSRGDLGSPAMSRLALKSDGSPHTLIILGSTGSIGVQALDLVDRNRDRFSIFGIAATGGQPDLLANQILEFSPQVVAVSHGTNVEEIQHRVYAHAQKNGFSRGSFAIPEFLIGPDAAARLASHGVDIVLNAIAGAAGLIPTMNALDAGSRLALANKESLIIGGDLVRERAKQGQIVPVDSEHSALDQALMSGNAHEVQRLILTASGGPFRGKTRQELADVTVAQALAHPTWNMGPLVTINSATMVNKGLEVIEAHLLFDIPYQNIEVVIHPQSIVHSMVEFTDGSTIAQVSPPDMRIPIAWGLAAPQRISGAGPACDWTQASSWDFYPLDEQAFPAVSLAKVAGTAGGTAPSVFNGADESAVSGFMAGQISFTSIVDVIERVLAEHLSGSGQGSGSTWVSGESLTLESVLASDAWSRSRAMEIMDHMRAG